MVLSLVTSLTGVYLGPAGSRTALHADVLFSYSWSANVAGRKRWLLVPAEQRHLVSDEATRPLKPDLRQLLQEVPDADGDDVRFARSPEVDSDVIMIRPQRGLGAPVPRASPYSAVPVPGPALTQGVPRMGVPRRTPVPQPRDGDEPPLQTRSNLRI